MSGYRILFNHFYLGMQWPFQYLDIDDSFERPKETPNTVVVQWMLKAVVGILQ